jgi:histidyl-tRNA synthetase
MEIVQMKGSRTPPVFLAFTPDVKIQAAKTAGLLRKSIPLVMDIMGRSLGAQLKAAAGAGAEFVIIVGKDELDAGKLTLRDMAGGEQASLDLTAIEEKLKKHFQ